MRIGRTRDVVVAEPLVSPVPGAATHTDAIPSRPEPSRATARPEPRRAEAPDRAAVPVAPCR